MLSVIKVGGSVLTDIAAYRRVARCLATRLVGDRSATLLVVVSAQEGMTDALLRLARTIAPAPDAATLDLLWSTGEQQSVALLTLALRHAGVRSIGLGTHELGLRARRRPDGTQDVRLGRGAVPWALTRHRAVVVPGFVALDRHGRVRSLGRGGSDLSAVVLARDLGAGRCEFIKDVPGYFTADPRAAADARPIPALDHADALAMAAAGCDLVQPAALAAAAQAGLPLLVRGLDAARPGTVVGAHPASCPAVTAGV